MVVTEVVAEMVTMSTLKLLASMNTPESNMLSRASATASLR